MANPMHLLREARRRRVFRTGGIYIVGAWALLQVVDLALESFGYPDTAMRFLWYAAAAGLPIALVFGWRYELSANGIRKTAAADQAAGRHLALKAVDYVIIAALGAIAVMIAGSALDEVRRIETSAGPTVSRQIDPNSLAVMPLANLSGDADQEYLSAGIHDALITSLSKLRRLRVTSRTSTLRVDSSLPMSGIGKALGVAMVIEGSVTRENDRVRVIVQLIDAASDVHIWADTFEREFTRVLSMQHEITRAVAAAIEMRLSPAEQQALPVDIDVRADTYEAYLRGMYLMHRENPRAYRRGLSILETAVENDPQSALAHAGLAYAHIKRGHSPLLPPEGVYPKAKAAAERALELDDTLAEAHLAIGMYNLYHEWDWVAAERSLLRAIEINPSLVTAHYHYAWMMELFLDHDKAIEHGEITKALDPLSPFMTGWLADQYRSAKLYDKAIAEAEATLELAPDYPIGHLVLGTTLSEMGRHEEAIAAHRKIGDDPFWAFALGGTLARAGKTEEARAMLENIPDTPEYTAPHILLNAALHNDEAVFHWMQIAKDVRAVWYPWFITWSNETQYLADDARLQALAEELDLTLGRSRNVSASNLDH